MQSDNEHVKYLQWLVERQGFERNKLAKDLDTTAVSVSRWLSGERSPSKAAQAKIEEMAVRHGHPFPVGSDLPAGVQRCGYTGRTYPMCETEFRFSDFYGGFIPPIAKNTVGDSIFNMYWEMLYLITQNGCASSLKEAMDMFLSVYEDQCRKWWHARFIDKVDLDTLECRTYCHDDGTRFRIYNMVRDRLFPLAKFGPARDQECFEDWVEDQCWQIDWCMYLKYNSGDMPCNGLEGIVGRSNATFDWGKKVWVGPPIRRVV